MGSFIIRHQISTDTRSASANKAHKYMTAVSRSVKQHHKYDPIAVGQTHIPSINTTAIIKQMYGIM